MLCLYEWNAGISFIFHKRKPFFDDLTTNIRTFEHCVCRKFSLFYHTEYALRMRIPKPERKIFKFLLWNFSERTIERMNGAREEKITERYIDKNHPFKCIHALALYSATTTTAL